MICFASSLLAASAAMGAWDHEDPFTASSDPAGRESTRRTPGWRTKPRHDNPAAEMDAAQRLEQAGRQRAALRRYRTVVANWPDSRQAIDAQLRIAETQEQRRRYQKAFSEYQYLVDHYAGRFPYLPVLESQYEIAMRLAAGIRQGWLPRFGSTQDAIPLLETLLRNAPTWEKATEIRAMLARLHEKHGHLDEAVSAYAGLQRRHPGTPEAQQAAFREIRCMILLSRKYPQDEVWAEETLAMLRRYLATVTEGEERERARRYRREIEDLLNGHWRQRAEFYDRIQPRPRAALIVYEEWLTRFPAMADAASVRHRIETLRTKVVDQ